MDSILNNPEIIALNGELAIAAGNAARYGARFLDENSPRILRLWAHTRTMCAIAECNRIINRLNSYPEIRRIQADIAARYGLTDADTTETAMQKMGLPIQ